MSKEVDPRDIAFFDIHQTTRPMARGVLSQASGAALPTQPAPAGEGAGASDHGNRDRVPGGEEERAVVRAVPGIDGGGDRAGCETCHGTGRCRVFRRALLQRPEQACKGGERQDGDEKQAEERIAADEAGPPSGFRQREKLRDDRDGDP